MTETLTQAVAQVCNRCSSFPVENRSHSFAIGASSPAICRAIGTVIAIVGVLAVAAGDVATPLASYEPSETDLTVTPNAGDSGLSVSIVPGGVGGAPVATDGDYVLKVTIFNEADRKVEFRHNWTTTTYDLAGQDELLADVYIADAGAIPNVMGVWSTNWSPPDAWQPASGLPATTGAWKTITCDVSNREQVGLNQIWAFIFENMAGTSGVAYVDNLRLNIKGPTTVITGIAANGLADHNEVFWKPDGAAGLDGYNVYRSESSSGPFTLLTTTPHADTQYSDPTDPNAPTLYYRVTSVVNGVESAPSDVAPALYNGLPNDELLDIVQQSTLGFMWYHGHPHCGMSRESYNMGHSSEIVTTGGTGMGIITIVAGAERGFVTRQDAASRMLRMARFLDGVDPDDPNQPSGVQRYHGAWSHWINGTTGATIPFNANDDGGDLVETAFLIEGLLTARQYFDDPNDPVETEIYSRATSMWETVEWTWYRRYPGSDTLYWHWSPNFGWDINLPIHGYDEAQIVYLLAIASPTYAMPSTSYHFGWASGGYVNGNTYYGYPLWVGPAYGGPMFFTHYSNLGFDPRYKRDAYANYYENARNIALIDRAHCIDNPGGYAGYSPLIWGLTASADPWGYLAHSPTVDNGTITPTASISSMPYTPEESLAALRHMSDMYGADLWGPYGLLDAFHLGEDWYAPGYLSIDQNTIVPMIENYRTGLCWNLFMSNPEIGPMMQAIGMYYEVDYDTDGDIDAGDLAIFAQCNAGVDVTTPPGGVTQSQFDDADLDNDGDVDMHDAAVFQRLFTGP